MGINDRFMTRGGRLRGAPHNPSLLGPPCAPQASTLTTKTPSSLILGLDDGLFVHIRKHVNMWVRLEDWFVGSGCCPPEYHTSSDLIRVLSAPHAIRTTGKHLCPFSAGEVHSLNPYTLSPERVAPAS